MTSDRAALARLRQRLPSTPPQLVALLRDAGPAPRPAASSPAGTGFVLFPADELTAARIAGVAAVVVFGGDGAGDLFAIAIADGRVFRLREADYLDGVYRGPGVTLVAADLAEFLDRLP
ncbi:hypothetical protein ACQP1P_22150 [Dactylosporangium sp. CA-052675]|uniref:hypothetical protein n=1 Tax=Dactylosporangium sp. CA-052675 TaxID=3239927 RepID=UPI003D92B163